MIKKKKRKIIFHKKSDKKNKEKSLRWKQERFCRLYSTDREFFANGVQTYIEVYEPNTSKPNWYKTVCAAASRLLSNVKVCYRINKLLEMNGLNDAFVDKQLTFLVTQHSDLGNKLGAIREYNKLKQRIIDKQDIQSGGKPITVNLTTYKKDGKK